MKVALFIALSLLTWIDPATVKKINQAKSAAEEAFKKGDYAGAARHYHYLVDTLGVNEDEVILNLANASYLAKDTANAVSHYQSVTDSPKSDIKSKAYQQLGIMANQQGRAEEALNLFKQAIKAEPTNDDARYNYEMLKKKLDEQKKKEEEKKQQQNKDQEKEDQQNKDQQNKEEQKDKEQQEKDQKNKDEQNKDQQQKDQEQKEKEEKEQQDKEQKEKEEQEQQEQKDAEKEKMPNLDKEKLQQMKISEEKARMILEAMKNQEKQYLQQQKRKPTQSRDRNEPDW
jgi:AAA ATPase containing von Willebrand factor type A (vWA) domain